MKPGLFASGAFVLVAFMGWQTSRISPITNPTTRISGLDVHDESASGSLLGQFRTNLTAWLWLHADLYLHNGVSLRPITPAEAKSGVTVQGPANDGHENLDSVASVTVIPSKDRDFRGLFGDAEREIAAYKDMHGHNHNDPEQCLPLYRLMTWLDPQFIEGWTTGAMVFARDRSPGGTKRALSFLTEGLGENPESLDIMTEMAYIHLTRKKDYTTAIPWLEKSRALGFSHRQNLSEGDRTALENAYRWLCLCYRDKGEPAMVRQVATEGLTIFPDDNALTRLMEKAGEHSGRNPAEADGPRSRA